jgi:GNAT superfamily N-acetyltransferase
VGTAPYATSAGGIDPAQLADIRVTAMRPSLKAVGRFDPIRARERFLASYAAQDTRLIYAQDTLAGFYVVRQRPDHIYLDHLYIHPKHQGGGLGRKVLGWVQREAQQAQLSIKLVALKNSRANDFYLSCGFAFVTSDAFDNHYIWHNV